MEGQPPTGDNFDLYEEKEEDQGAAYRCVQLATQHPLRLVRCQNDRVLLVSDLPFEERPFFPIEVWDGRTGILVRTIWNMGAWSAVCGVREGLAIVMADQVLRLDPEDPTQDHPTRLPLKDSPPTIAHAVGSQSDLVLLTRLFWNDTLVVNTRTMTIVGHCANDHRAFSCQSKPEALTNCVFVWSRRHELRLVDVSNDVVIFRLPQTRAVAASSKWLVTQRATIDEPSVLVVWDLERKAAQAQSDQEWPPIPAVAFVEPTVLMVNETLLWDFQSGRTYYLPASNPTPCSVISATVFVAQPDDGGPIHIYQRRP